MYRVILVDDDRALRYVYSKMNAWMKYGFAIAGETSNGIQALEWMKEHPADVVFTDIRMPFMDGITLMKEAQKLYPEVLFVFISSYDAFEYAREGLRLGAVDYVVKPMRDSDLENVLERLIPVMGRSGDEERISIFKKITEEDVNWEDPLLLRMCRYLEDHIDQNLTLEEVADALRLNKDYFGKIVKSRTGMNFRNLYNRFKMEYAKPLIKGGQYKIYEISRMLGYTASDYFTQLFKNSTGMTPLEYKKS